jgi:acetyl-CoA acetyltransferase
MFGSSGATATALAAAVIQAGLATNVLVVVSSGDDMRAPPRGAIVLGGFYEEQFELPYTLGHGANHFYALIAQRYQHEYGLTEEDRVSIAVQQRFNAQANPDAVFHGTPLTTDDVLNSRLIADPLRLLECVMPCLGAAAVLVTSAERARSGPNQPVYILGAGQAIDRNVPGVAYVHRMTTSPTAVSARKAFEMAGVSPADMGLVSIYDCYTITAIIELEDAGFCPKGEGGPFIASTDVTYKGTLPINTHGGQLSFGQPGTAGGMTHVTEAARQMMGRCGERQVKDLDYCFVNG